MLIFSLLLNSSVLAKTEDEFELEGEGIGQEEMSDLDLSGHLANPDDEDAPGADEGNVYRYKRGKKGQVRLSEAANVMHNGTSIAGTWLEGISQEALGEIDSADVIISKGQANFETLRKCGKNIYYIFLCKCNLFAQQFGVPRLTGMLVNDKDL